MIRVMVADDHAVVRQGLQMIFDLTSDIKLVREATSGNEVINFLRKALDVDLLLLDLQMPGISGISLIEAVKSYSNELPILVFSMNDNPQMNMRALKAGASGYVSKDKNPAILLEAIRKVRKGEK